jgi:hypothetical protein
MLYREIIAVCSEIHTIIHCIQEFQSCIFEGVRQFVASTTQAYLEQVTVRVSVPSASKVLQIPETAMTVNVQGAVKVYNISIAMKFPVSRRVGGACIILRRNDYDCEHQEAQNCSNTSRPTAVPDGLGCLFSCAVCTSTKENRPACAALNQI